MKKRLVYGLLLCVLCGFLAFAVTLAVSYKPRSYKTFIPVVSNAK